MSPRVNRDVSAIQVEIGPHPLGRGTKAEGGGPIQGGMLLMNRFTARITDPEVPYAITMTMAARDGWLACEAVEVHALPDGPPVSSATLRGLALSIYLQRIRQELGDSFGGGVIMQPLARTANATVLAPPVDPEDWEKFDYAQMRRAVHSSKITPEMAADAYREALASPDPDKNHRPTAAAADMLGASRGHVSRLLTEARRLGLPGLGPQRAARTQTGSGVDLTELIELSDEDRAEAVRMARELQGQGRGDRYSAGRGEDGTVTVVPMNGSSLRAPSSRQQRPGRQRRPAGGGHA